jgi:ADP-ribosylglycohydrolase
MTSISTVQHVYDVLMKNSTLSGMLLHSIDFGGDTDTLAALSLAIGSCSREITNDIPQELIDGLEDGPYGRHFLINLELRLRDEFDIVDPRVAI